MTRHLGADDPPKPRRRVVGVTRTPEEKAKIAEELIRQAAEAEAEAKAQAEATEAAKAPKKPRQPRKKKAEAAAATAAVAADIAAESQAAADMAKAEAEAKEAEAALATARAEAAAVAAAQAEAEVPAFYEAPPSEPIFQLGPPKAELPTSQTPPSPRQRRQAAVREPNPRKIRKDAKFIREGTRYNAPHGRLPNEPPVGNYCDRAVEHLSHFDPESLVWKKINSKTWNVMGCPVEQWRPRARRCSVAMRIQKIVIKPKSGKTTKPIACKFDADCPGKGRGAHVCSDEGVCVRAKCPPEMRRLKV